MLFNSYVFLFAFLPVSLAVFYCLLLIKSNLSIAWLALCSVGFYAWAAPQFTIILLASVVFNYVAFLITSKAMANGDMRSARTFLWFSVTLNLLALGYFKYMNFFVDIAIDTTGRAIPWTRVVLPIGISFFTFTQIAFQVDTYKGKVNQVKPVHYLLFVTYFPHLIAGPILHHSEMMPQFRGLRTSIRSTEAIAVGLTALIIGLFKKLLIADSLGYYADYAFSPVHVQSLTSPEAWRGVLAYTLQIYFDFSAYCDMAIGISRMFNITLPANFESPYKSCSIIDFWRRWHKTLSRFLRDYLYIPIGGNRRGVTRRYVNLMITMTLGGLWHGAGWNFIVWGLLHGAYLTINHCWSHAMARLKARNMRHLRLPRLLGWGITFLAVMVAWVFFRAPDIATAVELLRKMIGLNQDFTPAHQVPVLQWFAGDTEQFAWLVFGMVVALLMPNVRQIMGSHELVLPEGPSPNAVTRPKRGMLWRPDIGWAMAMVGLFALSLLHLGHVSPFLYFQF